MPDRDNVLRCKTTFNPHDKKTPFKTVCVFNGKKYRRRMDHIHSERQNVREISDYLLKQGHDIENIVYPDISMG